jgi:Ca2+-binding EF-hand superfamily protein
VPTILRYLGVWPPDLVLVEKILPAMQEDEPTRFVSYEKFEKVALELLASGEHAPDTEDVLLRAFRSLDPEDTGVLDPARIKELLMNEGDSPFREEEADIFLRFAADPEAGGKILYEEYIAKLAAAAQ